MRVMLLLRHGGRSGQGDLPLDLLTGPSSSFDRARTKFATRPGLPDQRSHPLMAEEVGVLAIWESIN